MTDTHPDDERSTDTETRADVAASIARERLAAELDPRESRAVDDLTKVLERLAGSLRADDVGPEQITDANYRLRKVGEAITDASNLYGFGSHDSGTDTATTDDRVAEILEPLEVSRDDLGSTEIVVSDAVRTHVYDEGEPPTVTVSLDALDTDAAEDTRRVTLDAEAAAQLRADLETAFTARVAERERYDEAEE